jgi:hypothetical protein
MHVGQKLHALIITAQQVRMFHPLLI